MSIRDEKQAISDYKKAASDGIGVIDLMVFYVEFGREFISNGYASEEYYTSMENMFKDAIILIKKFKNEEFTRFVERLRIVFEGSCDGYGHQDQLRTLFAMSYPLKK